MPRMGKDGYSDGETGQTKVTTRCPEDLKADYEAALEEQGRSMSEDIRDHMRNVVEDSKDSRESADALPDEPRLSRAYRALRRHADPDHNTLETDVAETVTAEATKVRASVVRQSVLQPLERRGYIAPAWGRIVVRSPDDVPGA